MIPDFSNFAAWGFRGAKRSAPAGTEKPSSATIMIGSRAISVRLAAIIVASAVAVVGLGAIIAGHPAVFLLSLIFALSAGGIAYALTQVGGTCQHFPNTRCEISM
jgi:hypothetical protein